MIGLFAVAWPIAAHADRYVVVLDIEGDKSDRLKKSITRMVKSAHKVMNGRNYRDAARRMRAVKLTPTNVKRVCNYLNADGVIDGTLVKEDGAYRFTLRLRSGKSGAITKKIPMRINQPSLSENMYGQLEERLLAAIDALPSLSGESRRGGKERIGGEPVEQDRKLTRAERRRLERERREEERRRAREEREEKRRLAREAARRKKEEAEERRRERDREREREREEDLEEEEFGEDELAEDEGGQAEDEEDPVGSRTAMADDDDDEFDDEDDEDAEIEGKLDGKAGGPTSPRTTPILINAGASFVGRVLSFRYAGDEADRPLGYRGNPVPGVLVEGEVYPMAFGGDRGVLANIGVGFVADRVIRLNSAVDDGMGGVATLGTRHSRYGASLLYRHNFGDGPRGLSLGLSVGYSRLSFVIDKAAAPEGVIVDVPNVVYSYLDPGASVRIPVGPLTALIEGKFLAVLGTGEIQQPEQYGAATVTGLDVDAGLEYRIGEHFLARAGARLMYLGFAFKGTGTLADRDQNGEVDVGGASDRYLGGYVTAGYAF
ncbi:MAG TPA: hypothetical protein VKZ63_20160 [Kofleriaceae bacterium]|nr:hypothetical protein [Kofleriaceae bacterium]